MKFNVKVFKCVYSYIYYFFLIATHMYKIVFINSQKQCDYITMHRLFLEFYSSVFFFPLQMLHDDSFTSFHLLNLVAKINYLRYTH